MRPFRALPGLSRSLVGSVATGAVLLALAVPASAAPHIRTATDPTLTNIVNGVLPPLDPTRPRGLRLGVDVKTGLYEVPAIGTFDAATGYRTDIVQGFVGWEYLGHPDWSEFPTSHVRDIVASGRTPQITWDPGVVGGPVDQPAYSLKSITRGAHDAYLTRFAQATRAIGSRIQIRLGHEMNGTWNTYSENHSGNTTGDFVQAWRYIHNLFKRVGATNVDWVWSPNVFDAPATSARNWYPGDDYVDWVGIDGYSYPVSGCPSAATLFGPAMTDLLSMSTKRVMIAETAVAEECGNKATWIKGLFTWATTQPRLELIIWWQRTETGRDWRFDSSPAATQGMRTQLQIQAARTAAALKPTPPPH